MSGQVEDPGAVGLVDWGRTGRRMRASAIVLGLLVAVAWVVLALFGDGFSLRTLGELTGLGMAVMFVVELVVVGGAAVRGMLRAGERGERLASQGVGLLPPRIRTPDEDVDDRPSRDGPTGSD